MLTATALVGDFWISVVSVQTVASPNITQYELHFRDIDTGRQVVVIAPSHDDAVKMFAVSLLIEMDGSITQSTEIVRLRLLLEQLLGEHAQFFFTPPWTRKPDDE